MADQGPKRRRFELDPSLFFDFRHFGFSSFDQDI
jgi:hypothetical protein